MEEIYYRKSNLSSFQWKQFYREMRTSLNKKLPEFQTNDHINADYFAESITSTYIDLIEKYMPRKKLSRKQKRYHQKPWITKGLRNSIKTKDKLY